MPELPEVETIRCGLERTIVGRRIAGVRGRAIGMRRPLEPERLDSILRGLRFTQVRRLGKYLLLDTASGSLLGHLGMSGRLVIVDSSATLARHTHCTIMLQGDRELRLVDPRRFGFLSWLAPGEERCDPSLSRLGIDPLRDDLKDRLPVLYKGRRAPIKSLLLDQRSVAGIGNIYATEALWMAGIRPTRRGRDISRRRLERLAEEVVRVLRSAIEQGGTTLKDFVSADGSSGYFAVRLHAYGRQGRPCPRCERPLRSARIVGRATVWCAHCQR